MELKQLCRPWLLVAATWATPILDGAAADAALLGWNNLGMHCMDSDYSVFSILPPYNTVHAQLIVGGRLVTDPSGYIVTYEAVDDPQGSVNTTSAGKGNFYTWASLLYGAELVPGQGLAGWSMPGASNTPQTMIFERTNTPAPGVHTRTEWFRAEGIPITPYDDQRAKNPYPLMRLVARLEGGQPVAASDVVLPVSDEMDCRACHSSGAGDAAKPSGGWAWSLSPERDYRLNILRLHDENRFSSEASLYADALAARSFSPQGLHHSVVVDQKPVLCASCHASEALGTASFQTIKSLTAATHHSHADVLDPVAGVTLNDSANRGACYRCHPGAETRCLRGAMGAAVNAEGELAVQCQSCHGNMEQVGSISRVGWFQEPTCQSCHTGTATQNSGEIRYTSSFAANGAVRVPAGFTFATQPDTPAPGLSLYRFSRGHGGLQCSACHGSTHAEFPSVHQNDNVRNLALQGHVGVVVECTACHPTIPNSATGGPHGLHPVGQGWVSGGNGVTEHGDQVERAGAAACQICHGTDYRGTVLSRAHDDRILVYNHDGQSATIPLFRGAQVGCYNCHRGPASDDPSTASTPVVGNVVTNTANNAPLAFLLPAGGPGVTVRVISPPRRGTAGIIRSLATYRPFGGFVGDDSFTYAAYNGSKNSLLATVTVHVIQGTVELRAEPRIPAKYPAMLPVPFSVHALAPNASPEPTCAWSFGDVAGESATGKDATHTYTQPGAYTWSVITSVLGVSRTNTGVIQITAPLQLSATESAGIVELRWPAADVDMLVERSSALGPLSAWSAWGTVIRPGVTNFTVSTSGSAEFFRLRRPL